MSAIVVAGGQSSRLGIDKRSLRLGSTLTLLEQTVARLQELSQDVIVVVSEDDVERFESLGTTIVRDALPGTGPASAVAAGLGVAQHAYSFVVAVDLPFLNAGALRALASYPRDYDLLVPRHANGRLEVLHGIYHRSCEAVIRRRIGQGQFKLALLADHVRVRYVEAEALVSSDARLPPLFNLNTPDDLATVKRLIR